MHEQTTYRFIIQEAYGEWNIMSGNHPNGGWIAWAKKGTLLKRDPLEEPGEVFFEFGLGRQGAIDLLIKNNHINTSKQHTTTGDRDETIHDER